jgi:hypothetical protein
MSIAYISIAFDPIEDKYYVSMVSGRENRHNARVYGYRAAVDVIRTIVEFLLTLGWRPISIHYVQREVGGQIWLQHEVPHMGIDGKKIEEALYMLADVV